MIKFFRHRRRDIIETGKTGKHLKYAIGKIVLVVIGILIALSINNWNEKVKNKHKEKDHLVNLLQELKMDKLRPNTLKNEFEAVLTLLK